MNEFIKQQQELAKGAAAYAHPDTRNMVESAIQAVIATVVTNTGEELLRLAEGERLRSINEDDYVRKIFEEVQKMPLVGTNPHYRAGAEHGYNKALDTLKKHIASVTRVKDNQK